MAYSGASPGLRLLYSDHPDVSLAPLDADADGIGMLMVRGGFRTGTSRTSSNVFWHGEHRVA